MTDGLRFVELTGSDEGEEISLEPRLVFPVEFGQRLFLPRRGVWIQLGHVTNLVAARTPQRVESVFPSLCFVGEELDLLVEEGVRSSDR